MLVTKYATAGGDASSYFTNSHYTGAAALRVGAAAPALTGPGSYSLDALLGLTSLWN